MIFLNFLVIMLGVCAMLFGAACFGAKDWVWRLEQKRLQWNGIRAERADEWDDTFSLHGVTYLIIGAALIAHAIWRAFR
ncbi:hypothetical protein SE17_01255 [Kouleothrix aurantiaca]|uniref:Uncharacterized protein n=1 Tax=Kouleothrix aurantiaca TaxID=186479 RepID=A0A0P9DN09_9CHLR|nr:hypothetical protein SE17_01255 [Kouleothrix aurantiaca]